MASPSEAGPLQEELDLPWNESANDSDAFASAGNSSLTSWEFPKIRGHDIDPK